VNEPSAIFETLEAADNKIGIACGEDDEAPPAMVLSFNPNLIDHRVFARGARASIEIVKYDRHTAPLCLALQP
jgi:hypothetical protein